jgi:hypothetical protein
MDVRTRLIVALAIAAMLLLGVGFVLTHRAAEQSGFQRDDTPLLATDDMGLSSAYKALKDAGRRVAIDRSELEPKPAYAWWIMQPHIDWFTADHAVAIRRFVEAGGIAVLLPEESVIQIGDAEPQEELADFFKALDLDLQIVAFDPPAEEDEDSEADDPEDDPDPASITLPTSGKGEPFAKIAELQTSWGNYFDGESLLKAEIRVHSDGFPLVAEFNLGKGRLVVVAESTYFENEFLDRSQNRSLLLALADSYGKDGIVLHPPATDDQRASE